MKNLFNKHISVFILHHRNTQYSHTCEYWRQTSTMEEYRQIQEARRSRLNNWIIFNFEKM